MGSGTGAVLCLLYECNCLQFCVCYTSVIGVFFCDTSVVCAVLFVYDSYLC